MNHKNIKTMFFADMHDLIYMGVLIEIDTGLICDVIKINQLSTSFVFDCSE